MEENKMENPNIQEDAITQPEENGNPAAERMFTQDEVNDIVRDRLARSHKEDQGWELFVKKAGSLHKQEEDIKKREYFYRHNLNPEFIGLIAGETYGKWEKNAETFRRMVIDEARYMISQHDERLKPSDSQDSPDAPSAPLSAASAPRTPSNALRQIFGLGKRS